MNLMEKNAEEKNLKNVKQKPRFNVEGTVGEEFKLNKLGTFM